MTPQEPTTPPIGDEEKSELTRPSTGDTPRPTNEAWHEPLDAETLHERLKNYGYASIMQAGSIAQGGAMAIAAMTLVELMRAPDRDAIRLLLWFVSLIGCGAIYVASIRAAIMEPEGGRFGQFAYMFVTVSELLQFVVLVPKEGADTAYRDWLAVTAFGGVAIIWEAINRNRRLAEGVYAKDLMALVQLSVQKGWRRVYGMSAVVLPMAAIVIAQLAGILTEQTLNVAAVAAGMSYGVIAFGAYVQIHFERLAITRTVNEARRKTAA